MSEAYTVVIPSLGRPTLVELVRGLARQDGPAPAEVIVVDDRPRPEPALQIPLDVSDGLTVRIVPGLGRGPAAARNLGGRLARTPWIAFLDDDVLVPDGWASRLQEDLAAAGDRVAGVQGRIRVPLPDGRRPTDWERSTAGLEEAQWPTADLAYRAAALWQVHGFDERFPRAYREDADLAFRVRQAGWHVVAGKRQVVHPVRPVDRSVSVRVQRGNADDALMRRLHGPDWRRRAGTGRGRLPWHVATTASAVVALLGLGGVAAARAASTRAAGTRAASTRSGTTRPAATLAAGGAAAWAALTVDFFAKRVVPGPRTPDEIVTMAWTSVAIPPVAVAHRLVGWWRHRHAGAWPPAPQAVLFDRDGTIVEDVPYNGDPTRVQLVPTARAAVDRLRAEGLRLGVITNQSGVARGLVHRDEVRAVNEEIERALGPFDTWQVCMHGPEDGCECRKPQAGMVRAAARRLGVDPADCVVIGDIGADVLAARAAGAVGILVPTPVTRPDEVAAAPHVAENLAAAVDLVLERGRVNA